MKCRGIDPDCANFDLVRYWLLHCTLFHSLFCDPLVWTASPSASFTLRMIDVKRQCIVKAPKNCQYLALSYRWPKNPKVRLTQDTYPQLTRSGGLAERKRDMPKTISDAIIVCKNVKKRYLWVDALCIIQDSANDLAEQIENMGFVYSGAFLTIAAGYGEDGDAGLPGVSNIPRKRQYCTMNIGHLELTTAPSNPMENLLFSTWYSRGWTYQELILSKRVLAFTEDMMLFFCVQGSFREDTVLEPFNGTIKAVQKLGGMLDSPLNLTTERFQGEVFEHVALRSYEGFLERYLYRNLSNDNDILNAFGGILEALFVHMGPFRWGIPVTLATQAMTWHSKDEFPLKRRRGFPTWSWTAWKDFKEPVRLKKSAFHHDERYVSSSNQNRNLKWVLTKEGSMHEIRRLCGLLPESFDWDLPMDPDGLPFEDPRVWNIVSDTYDQYILFWTDCAFLDVDQEPEIEVDEQNGGIKHVFYARNRGNKICGFILNPNWRKQKPDQLECIAFAGTTDWVEVMLIERSDPVAYRVQISHEWVYCSRWEQCSRKWKKVILG